MQEGRGCRYGPGPMASLRARCTLAVPLRRLFDRWSRPLQVLRCHHRMDLYGRVQSDIFRSARDICIPLLITIHYRRTRGLRREPKSRARQLPQAEAEALAFEIGDHLGRIRKPGLGELKVAAVGYLKPTHVKMHHVAGNPLLAQLLCD